MNPAFPNPVLIILFLILLLGTVFGIFYMYFTTRTKERLALIEKGMDPNLANSNFFVIIGLIAIGIAGGLILGDILPTKFGYGPLLGFLLAGINLVIYYLYKDKKKKKIS